MQGVAKHSGKNSLCSLYNTCCHIERVFENALEVNLISLPWQILQTEAIRNQIYNRLKHHEKAMYQHYRKRCYG